ncbi:MAG: CAP domain-containing protein [Methylovirgula sp.]
MPHIFCRKIVLAALLVLAACAPPPAPLVAEPPVNLSDRERAARHVRVDPAQAASLISQYRNTRGLGAVAPDAVLQGLAQAQADSMAAHNVLSHTVDGALSARFDAAGLAQTTAVENVSAGYFSLPAALAGWRNSPEHNANLLASKMRRLGIATAYAPGTRYLVFWALDMSN